ncbi:unnamed protein product [Blepharisma stoltei]|uniref:UBC core domain-containing protein n=1 Tax=Blepharisma stoltei TaxID=1481888 RepID=A0AAU9INW1_9CILI|nr:unnamed protein product [Blepharisma stoltei]
MEAIMSQYNSLLMQPEPSFMISIANNDYSRWNCVMEGPPDTPYAGGIFHFTMDLANYPNTCPVIVFQTPIYHPNISPEGGMCWDLYYGKWIRTIPIRIVFTYLIGLLANPTSHQNSLQEADNLLKTNREMFNLRAREYTQRYAK